MSHLLAVASIVLEHWGDEDQACAALLHDAIEDGGAAWETKIEHEFGPRVAGHLETEGTDALLVSAADKLHNARAIVSDLRTHGPGMLSRFNADQAETLWYYEALAKLFARRLTGPLSRELSDAVVQMRSLAEAG